MDVPMRVHMPPSIDEKESGISSTRSESFERAAHVSVTCAGRGRHGLSSEQPRARAAHAHAHDAHAHDAP